MIRAPIITIMGHVDHGKTTLLDFLRRSKITTQEQGGITQHIGAYQILFKQSKLTFIDTPGHAAFNKMRERGAHVTDIVILVVGVNDGVKPQTIEAIKLIQKIGLPFVVALNKIDLPDTNIVKIKSQLAEYNVVATDFGGDVEMIEISAKTGKNIDKLLDTIKIIAEFAQLETNTPTQLEAIIIESSKHAQQGPLANIIVKNGTLKLKQDIYTSNTYGKVRAIINDMGQRLTELQPGEPGQILGLKKVPLVGDIITSEKQIVDEVKIEKKEFTIDFTDFNQEEKLKFILKADTQGTQEAIEQHLDPDNINIIATGIGDISDSDLELAQISGAKILAFGVKIPSAIIQRAKMLNVKIKSFAIIYDLITYIEKKLLKLIEPTIDEIITGEAEIQEIFTMKGLKVAGLKIKSGELKKGDLLHLKRNDEIIANPTINTMMHGKQEINRTKGVEQCGVVFKQKKLDFQVNDTLVAYEVDD